jgi:hypothetical protein
MSATITRQSSTAKSHGFLFRDSSIDRGIPHRDEKPRTERGSIVDPFLIRAIEIDERQPLLSNTGKPDRSLHPFFIRAF